MARKELVAALSTMAVLTGAGCAETTQHSVPNPKKTLAVPSPPAGYIGQWPSIDQCPQQGVYALSQDPTPEPACRTGAAIKSRIDSGQEVNFIDYHGFTYVRGLGNCMLNMLTTEGTVGASSSNYAGLARVGQNNNAEVVFFRYESDTPSKIEIAVLQPTDYGVYATLKNNMPAPIGVLVGQSYCQK